MPKSRTLAGRTENGTKRKTRPERTFRAGFHMCIYFATFSQKRMRIVAICARVVLPRGSR